MKEALKMFKIDMKSKSDNYDSGLATIIRSKESNEIYEKPSTNIIWCVDYGATSCIYNNEKYFQTLNHDENDKIVSERRFLRLFGKMFNNFESPCRKWNLQYEIW